MSKQNFSAKSAQRIVGRFVADEVSYLLRAGEPALVLSKRLYRRVPVQLAFPDRGMIGTAGTLDVDVETGQPENSSRITRIAQIGFYDCSGRSPTEPARFHGRLPQG